MGRHTWSSCRLIQLLPMEPEPCALPWGRLRSRPPLQAGSAVRTAATLAWSGDTGSPRSTSLHLGRSFLGSRRKGPYDQALLALRSTPVAPMPTHHRGRPPLPSSSQGQPLMELCQSSEPGRPSEVMVHSSLRTCRARHIAFLLWASAFSLPKGTFLNFPGAVSIRSILMYLHHRDGCSFMMQDQRHHEILPDSSNHRAKAVGRQQRAFHPQALGSQSLTPGHPSNAQTQIIWVPILGPGASRG